LKFGSYLVFGGVEFPGTGFLDSDFDGRGAASGGSAAAGWGGGGGGGGGGGATFVSYIWVSCCGLAISSLFDLLRTKNTNANAARMTSPAIDPITIPAMAPELNLLEDVAEVGPFDTVAIAAEDEVVANWLNVDDEGFVVGAVVRVVVGVGVVAVAVAVAVGRIGEEAPFPNPPSGADVAPDSSAVFVSTQSQNSSKGGKPVTIEPSENESPPVVEGTKVAELSVVVVVGPSLTAPGFCPRSSSSYCASTNGNTSIQDRILISIAWRCPTGVMRIEASTRPITGGDAKTRHSHVSMPNPV
jgi:hypothetical protein